MTATPCDADAIFRVFTVTPGGTDITTLILDVRKKEHFRKQHVAQAFCVRLASNGKALVDYSHAEYTSLKFAADCWWGKNVIVYGDSSLRKDHPALDFLSKQGKCHKLLFYKDGFDELRKKYPFICTASVKDQPSMKYPSQIVPGLLYLGDWSHAEASDRLDDLHIRTVITVHNHPDNLKLPTRFKHLRFPLPDVDSADISAYFNPTFEAIEEAKHKGHAVLVHCGAGVSRSASLVMMYLMRSKMWSAQKAKDVCIERRSLVCPNPGFWRGLCALEPALGIPASSRSDPDAMGGGEEEGARPAPLRSDAAGVKVPVKILSRNEVKRRQESGEDRDAKRQRRDESGKHYIITIEVSKAKEVVGHMEVGPMSYAQRLIFGRQPDCDVVLEHLSISRQHAQITVDAGGSVFVTDMQSGHGTKLNDTWLRAQTAKQMQKGSVLSFGASSRSYKLLSVVPA